MEVQVSVNSGGLQFTHVPNTTTSSSVVLTELNEPSAQPEFSQLPAPGVVQAVNIQPTESIELAAVQSEGIQISETVEPVAAQSDDQISPASTEVMSESFSS